MKTMIKRMLLLCLVILVLLPAAAAFAEGESAADRGLEAIRGTRNWRFLTLPREESYLDEWKTLYVGHVKNTPHSYVENYPAEHSGYPIAPFVFEGTEVTVVAEENGMSLILYTTPTFKYCSGWVPSARLQDAFPGETLVIGEPREEETDVQHEVGFRWSNSYFPGTIQIFTVPTEEISGCVGFTFEYQMTAENTTDNTWMVYGPRTLYLNDGDKWIELGTFEYDEQGAVRVQVWLDEPTNVAGLATLAHCDAPNHFGYRQTALDFLFEKEEAAEPAA